MKNKIINYKMKIVAVDVDGNWSLDKYSAQRGHLLRFMTNIKEEDIKTIEWNMNGVTYYTPCVTHVFMKNGLPAEGIANIICDIVTESNKKIRLTKEILIVPRVRCMLQFEIRESINNDTKFIDMLGNPLCEAISLGNPLLDTPENENYNCGGACIDACPEFEVFISELKGTRIYKYGKHKIKANVTINGEENLNCIPLYQKNFLGTNARYPPLISRFCILPEKRELKITSLKLKKYQRELSIDGLSSFMLPKDFYICWKIEKIGNINGEKINEDKWKIHKSKKFRYDFRKSGEYRIKVKIYIPHCPSVSQKCTLLLFHNQPDIIEHKDRFYM